MGRVRDRPWRTLVPMVAAVLVTGCDRTPAAPAVPGDRLEAAAIAAGLVVDPATASITGSWARENARLCIVPAAGGTRIGAVLDFGEGQGCAGAGTVDRRGDRLRVSLGECRFDARFDGDRIAFPAELPRACEALCTGRASLDALAVDRLSSSIAEAATLRSPAGRPLCES